MRTIDRSVIAGLHAAARHQRSVHVSCLLKSFATRLLGLFAVDTRRTAPCG